MVPVWFIFTMALILGFLAGFVSAIRPRGYC